MLDVSRRTAIFFNKETGLQPDLVVVSPLSRAIQSATISFPTYTPHLSLSNTPWICHPLCMEQANGNKSGFVSSFEDLKQTFPGVDFTLLEESVAGNVDELNEREKVLLFESKVDLMRRTNEFLAWIKERDERVIVGKFRGRITSRNGTLHCTNCLYSYLHSFKSRNVVAFTLRILPPIRTRKQGPCNVQEGRIEICRNQVSVNGNQAGSATAHEKDVYVAL